MGTDYETFRQRILDALEAPVRTRDEVMLARRLMAARIGQALGDDQFGSPFTLVDADIEITDSEELQGLERQYIEAVKRNIKVRMEFFEAQRESTEMMASLDQEDTDSRILDLHLEINKLKQRQNNLNIVQKYLDQLQQQPVAAPDYLDPEVMYKDCRPLPEVPKEMVDGFAIDHDATDAEVEQLLQRLKKSVLRNKLMARREKQRLEQSQASGPIDLKNLTPEVKLHALNAVKNTLIDWIDVQLNKADSAQEPSTLQEKSEHKAQSSTAHEAQLADIQAEYARHIELRKQILALLAQQRQMKSDSINETKNQPKKEESIDAKPIPTAYLLTPYVEKLQALARDQKALIQEKAHINASLSKQQDDTKVTLDHLAQESQLLPKYPAAKASKQNLSFEDAMKSVSKSTVMNQVQPWIYAADSAKIATLETVAEKVDEGMMSIDESRETLEEICKLLNISLQRDGSAEKQSVPEKDLWLPEGDDDITTVSSTKETKTEPEPPKTIWSILDGNLGSIND